MLEWNEQIMAVIMAFIFCTGKSDLIKARNGKSFACVQQTGASIYQVLLTRMVYGAIPRPYHSSLTDMQILS